MTCRTRGAQRLDGLAEQPIGSHAQDGVLRVKRVEFSTRHPRARESQLGNTLLHSREISPGLLPQ